MLRGLLLLGATLPLVGLGGGSASHVRNGRIAFEHIAESSRHTAIYSMTALGTKRQLLTPNRQRASGSPTYSPSGRRIAYVSRHPPDLWTMNSDGSHTLRLTHTSGIVETDPDWSPDGKEIAFAASGRGAEGIFVLGADGKDPRQLTNEFDSQPSWSPDGTKIAFDRWNPGTGTVSILVVPTGGGTPRVLNSHLHHPGISDLDPDWSPDGSRILFASDRPGTFQLDLWTMSADGGDLRRVTNTAGRDEHDAVWSPNGRWIAYVGESSSHGASSHQLYVSRANGSSVRRITHACGKCAIVNDDPSWQPLP